METYIVARVGDDKENYLYHHGTKGQKWGQRLYQNKDGSLTPLGRLRYGSGSEGGKGGTVKKKVSRKVQKQRAANLQKAREAKAAKAEEQKSIEETRKKLLNSNDAKEIFENRHLLTTAELKERIDRINTETLLSSKISQDQQKTGLDKFNDMMTKSSKTIDNVTGLYRSVDNAYSTVANSAIGKMVAKQLGIEPPKKEFNLAKTWAERNKLTTQEMMDLNKRLTAEKSIEAEIDRRNQKAKDEADKKKSYEEGKKAYDDYNSNLNKESSNTTYRMKGDDIQDSKVGTGGKAGNTSTPRLEAKSSAQTNKTETYTGEVEGEGTSKFSGWKSGKTVNAKKGRDYWDVTEDVQTTALSVYTSPSRKETYSLGQNYVAGLLEDKNR